MYLSTFHLNPCKHHLQHSHGTMLSSDSELTWRFGADMKIQDFRTELRSQLEAICRNNKWNYDNAKQRGMAFENWCFELLRDRYPAADINPDDCIIRGDDMEIDIWFESKETEEIYLIQAKHPKPAATDPIEEAEVKS